MKLQRFDPASPTSVVLLCMELACQMKVLHKTTNINSFLQYLEIVFVIVKTFSLLCFLEIRKEH